MSLLPHLLVLGAAALLSACAGVSKSAHSAPDAASEPVLTASQIANSSATNAYDAVQFLCPPRVRSSVDQRGIFVDGIRVGNANLLRSVPSDVIAEIRWLDARDAVIKYGSANLDGVILIITKPAS